MCTSITLKSADGSHLLARTMDFSFELEPEMMVVPRNKPIRFHYNEGVLEHHYGFMGLAKNLGSVLFADGVNEKGLSGAALYFEGYAHFASEPREGVPAIASEELIVWMLAHCATVEEVVEMFEAHDIVGHVVPFLGVTPPLHWIFQDADGESVIVECKKEGLHIYPNQLGVLTNSPDYEWHLTNVRNYIGLHPEQSEARTLYGQEFRPFGQGSGTFGLPGDLTPPSRFIRTLYNKLSSKQAKDAHTLLISASHILNNVDIPKGSVITHRNTIDYTQYTAYILNNLCQYTYRLYGELSVVTHTLGDYDLEGTELITF